MSTHESGIEPRRERAMDVKTIVKLVIVGIAALLLLIVIIQNTETVHTKIFWMELPMPRIVLLFVTMAIGFALGMTAALTWFAPRRRD